MLFLLLKIAPLLLVAFGLGWMIRARLFRSRYHDVTERMQKLEVLGEQHAESLEAARNVAKRAEKRLAATQAKAMQERNEWSAAKERAAAAEDELHALHDRLQQTEGALDSLRTEEHEVETRAHVLKKQLSQARFELESKRIESRHAAEQYDAEIKALRARLTEANQAQSALGERAVLSARVRERAMELEAALAQTHSVLEETRGDLSRMRAEREKLRVDVEALHELREADVERLAELNRSLSEAQVQNEALLERLGLPSGSALLDGAQDDKLAELEAKNIELRLQNEVLRNRLEGVAETRSAADVVIDADPEREKKVDALLQNVVELRRDLGSIVPAPLDDTAPMLFAEGPLRGQPDDLKQIRGIGEKLEGLLNDLGVYYFWQIAAWSDTDIAYVDERLESFRGRIGRDGWVSQAKSFAEDLPSNEVSLL